MPTVTAQELAYSKATVSEVISTEEISQDPVLYIQVVRVQLTASNEPVTIVMGSEYQPVTRAQLLKPGMDIIVAQQQLADGSSEYVFFDVYRLPTVYWLLALFIAVVFIVGRWKGLSSFIGMVVSIAVLLQFVVPQILQGQNPVMISMIAAVVIGSVTLYISHGWNSMSHIALGSLLLALLAVASISTVAVKAAHLVGLGSEEAYFLQYGDTAKINLQGLLLGGIILGSLGVLDDVTVSQVSLVYQLRLLRKKTDWVELYKRGISVGKDHVASLVNTLVLAYAGANLPLFILFVLADNTPHWVTLNSEVIIEEVIRTLAGSVGLVLAVPITTAAAAWWAARTEHVVLEKQFGHATGHDHTH